MYELSSKYPALILIAFIAAGLAISILTYRRKELSKGTKIFFISLRTIAITLLLVLFLQPSLLAIIKKSPENINLLLIDGSRSNQLPGGDKKLKSQQIKDYYSASKLNDNIRVYAFSSGLNKISKESPLDSNKSDGYQTDLAGSLKKARETFSDDRINSVTIISDGNFNTGDNPLNEVKLFGCPFVTIAVGDSVQRKDAVISRVDYNRNAFTKTPTIVKVQLSVFGCKGENAEVTLSKEGSLISQKTILVNDDSFDSEADFSVSESVPGIYRYSVLVKPLGNEITDKNNKSEFLINYIDNTTKILFVSGGPGYDNGDVQNIMGRIENFKTTFYTLKTPSTFYEGAINPNIYADLSAVFLYNFPVSNAEGSLISNIAENVKRFKIPVIFFAGRNTDYQKLAAMDDYLPFKVSRTNAGETSVNLQQVTKSSGEKTSEIINNLAGLPTVYKNAGVIVQKSGSEVLLIDRNSGEPMLVNRKADKNYSTAFLGYGFWKWSLNSGASNEKSLEKLLITAVNITLNKEKKQRVILEVPDKVIDYLEDVTLEGRVFDEDYNPTQNAELTAIIKGKSTGTIKNVTFTSASGRYSVNIGKLPADDYTIEANAELKKVFIGKDISRFIVDTTAAEYLKTTSDFSALRSLADNSGGRFYVLTGAKDLGNVISEAEQLNKTSAKTEEVMFKKYNLWENKFYLFAIILMFTAEWFFKKRKNLP